MSFVAPPELPLGRSARTGKGSLSQIVNTFKEQRRRGGANLFVDAPRAPRNRVVASSINPDPSAAAASRARQAALADVERRKAIHKLAGKLRGLQHHLNGARGPGKATRLRATIAAMQAQLRELQLSLTPSGTNTGR